MSSEENKAIVRRFVEEVWGNANLAVADELVAPNILVHGAGTDNSVGIEHVKQLAQHIRANNPTSSAQLDDIIADDDKVVVRVIARDVADPWAVITIFRLADGKIVEEWGLVGKPWN
jgi:predicted SnoaL-like aldol condensation-catalyzing enzyme